MILDCARARTGAPGALRLWILALGAALATALGGCSTNTNVTNGTPVVTVHTDAAVSFSTYVVGITLYSLTRSDGYVAYPAGYTAEEFADLTQRVDLTELLNAVGIPAGTYKSIVIGIDYSEPIVYVRGQTTAANVLNTSEDNPGIVYITVTLDPAHPLVVSENKSTPFALDFDLAASNSISSGTVTVRPFVAATATPTDTEQVRARGLFVVSNPSSGNFIEDLRPFEDNIYSTVGALTVNTTASTYFNINGTIYTGAAGLTALVGLSPSTPMVVYGALGDMSTITPGFTATQVYAGDVVSNGVFEHVEGVVSAISGNTLTVLGATYLYYEGYCISNLCFDYYPTATISVSPTIPVTEDGVPGTFSTHSISVGSQIDAVGIGTVSTSNALTLDATSGLVRLQSTPIWGTLNSGTVGSATLHLLSMGTVNFAASGFDFAGTGISSASDASAASYEINTGTADESAITLGTLMWADGFPTSFGAAPPDFDATAIMPATSEPADLIVEWINGTSASIVPFTSYNSTSLTLNLNSTDIAGVDIGPYSTKLTGTPTVNISGATQFAIGNATDGISMYSSSSAFASDLIGKLNGSSAVYRLVAIGTFDHATNTFTASRVDLALE
ncbi:MAG TPA: hypothetical protein VMD06_03075 [Steroidobacteraceae bacterium]|nr:hypothetical protein [Steroidobacteraceae bacterium]